MSAIEKSLERIASKAKLREWVDSLPDDATGVILMALAETEDAPETYRFFEIGKCNVCQTNWLVDTFKLFILGSQVEIT